MAYDLFFDFLNENKYFFQLKVGCSVWLLIGMVSVSYVWLFFFAKIWPHCLLSLPHGIFAQPFPYTEISNITLSGSDFI